MRVEIIVRLGDTESILEVELPKEGDFEFTPQQIAMLEAKVDSVASFENKSS